MAMFPGLSWLFTENVPPGMVTVMTCVALSERGTLVGRFYPGLRPGLNCCRPFGAKSGPVTEEALLWVIAAKASRIEKTPGAFGLYPFAPFWQAYFFCCASERRKVSYVSIQ
jgi:hypothetical protein